MNWIDTVITATLGINVFNGLRRGLILSLFDILSAVLGVVFALKWAQAGLDILTETFKLSEPVAYVLSFILTWLSIYCVISLIGAILHKFLSFSFMLPLDILGGGAIGLAKGILFVLVIFIPLSMIPSLPANLSGSLQESVLLTWVKPTVNQKLPEIGINIENWQQNFSKKTSSLLDEKIKL